MPAFFSWKPRACQLGEERGKKKKLEKQRVECREKGRSGKKKIRTENRIQRKSEPTKCFYSQTWGWRCKMRQWIGIKSGGITAAFHNIAICCGVTCTCAVVVVWTLAILPVSRFKSILSLTLLPSRSLAFSAFYKREARGALLETNTYFIQGYLLGADAALFHVLIGSQWLKKKKSIFTLGKPGITVCTCSDGATNKLNHPASGGLFFYKFAGQTFF